MTAEETLYPTAALVSTHVSARQLRYWAGVGLLHPVRTAPGTGHPCGWTQRDRDVVTWIGRLRADGLSPAVAARLAVEFVDAGTEEVLLPVSRVTVSRARGEAGASSLLGTVAVLVLVAALAQAVLGVDVVGYAEAVVDTVADWLTREVL